MLLTATLPSRRPSRSARWALNLAVFLPVLAGLSILAHRGTLIDTPTLLVLVALCGLLCLLGLLLFAFGLRSLWVHGTRGGRRLSWALFLLMPFVVLYAIAALAWALRPALSDVSTDLIDPPVFASERRAHGTGAPAVVAGRLHDGYPELLGTRFKAPLDATDGVVTEVAETLGWQRVRGRGRIGADDELFVEYAYKTPVLNMPVQIVVRTTDEGETTFVDVRARMPHLRHDLGISAGIVRRFLADVDYEMIGIAEP
ncbi:MAG: DUF1499 domain-containing protein [Roseitalea sp.]|uniref:DUF1499 domain-containing protein n=1 Tax=Oceaniradius stylonematis TaxID=2184161 RepID=A0A3A8A8J0_9HYPH|nr:DUF1499 domain-containing protein [Oceaniradius stylonematis]MBO6554524.1 DUF1499 domain-containing protein [Roseitalea sp.]MBO6953567.1 DUF1499 domain-containing protein [Rhizobiaceae bacterium]MBO6594004.1 DUF1499 domain-containing protein [Roseitalea sp.]MBO6601311.1 DUF1499 domain-containing protein [Roseitalea sp.]MBO6612807.1 DUF1499 domain-containing protein [Roseitalea sp.]